MTQSKSCDWRNGQTSTCWAAVAPTLNRLDIKLALETLARRPGIVFSRERCITLAWPDDTNAIDRTVDVHVARLRRIFGRDTVNIRTVQGVGYAIDPPAAE
jgi:DNA-binding response OmpR family regulator